MEIVPTSTSKKRETGLETLISRKAVLKQQIEDQKYQISSTTQQLLSPVAFSTNVLRAFWKGFNVIDSVMIGFKLVRLVRRFFTKK
jgi:hypothetical protein